MSKSGKANRAAGTVVPTGSEIYLIWLTITMAYELGGSDPKHRHLFQKYMESQNAAFRILDARGVAKFKKGLGRRGMLAEIGQLVGALLKDWSDEFPAEVEQARTDINAALDLFPVFISEDDLEDEDDLS